MWKLKFCMDLNKKNYKNIHFKRLRICYKNFQICKKKNIEYNATKSNLFVVIIIFNSFFLYFFLR